LLRSVTRAVERECRFLLKLTEEAG
jgi:hypothetical protein